MSESSQIGKESRGISDRLPRWYAVHTRSRHEKRIELSLRQAGVDTFLPLVREVHRWSEAQGSRASAVSLLPVCAHRAGNGGPAHRTENVRGTQFCRYAGFGVLNSRSGD